MRNRTQASWTALALIALVAALPVGQSPLEDSSRPAEERERDAGSMPLEVYAWLGVQPGMTVGDMLPGGGYNTHVLSNVVGDAGRVIGLWGARGREALMTRFGDTGNVELPEDTSGIESGSVDVVITVRNVHDLFLYNQPTDEMFGEVLRILKPGGVFGVIDARTSKDGADEETHRINEDFVVDAITAAGFELDSRSELLSNPNDDGTSGGFPTRWHVDRFLLKFRKSM